MYRETDNTMEHIENFKRETAEHEEGNPMYGVPPGA